jgi:cupin 2 domain-containing protein
MTTPVTTNLFDNLPDALPDELVTILAESPNLRIERIVSTGQASPPGFWYDQDRAEAVLLLRGRAGLEFEGETAPRVLEAGDWLTIPAHRRHRVAWTDPDRPTVWLAIHYACTDA